VRRFPNKLFNQQNSLQLLKTHIVKLYGKRTCTSRLIKFHSERLSVRENFLEQEEAKKELKIEAKMHGMHPRVCAPVANSSDNGILHWTRKWPAIEK